MRARPGWRERNRRRLERAPWWLHALLLWVVVLPVFVVVNALSGILWDGAPAFPGVGVVAMSAVVSVILGIYSRRSLQRFIRAVGPLPGGRRTEIGRSLRPGAPVPEDEEVRSAGERMVAYYLRQLRRQWWGPVFFGAVALAYAVSALRGSTPGWWGAAFFAAGAVGHVTMTWWYRRRLAELRAAAPTRTYAREMSDPTPGDRLHDVPDPAVSPLRDVLVDFASAPGPAGGVTVHGPTTRAYRDFVAGGPDPEGVEVLVVTATHTFRASVGADPAGLADLGVGVASALQDDVMDELAAPWPEVPRADGPGTCVLEPVVGEDGRSVPVGRLHDVLDEAP